MTLDTVSHTISTAKLIACGILIVALVISLNTDRSK